MAITRWLVTLACMVSIITPGAADEPLSRPEAQRTLRRVVRFYRTEVGYQGAYLWRYAADLSRQEGEGIATKTSGWTQPPGAPSVGEAYLKAWRLSGESVCLEAAVEVAHALVCSQLRSGGWSSHFDLGPDGIRRYAYVVDGRGLHNSTTFDDNKSQSALMLLMHVDEALQFQDQRITTAVGYALKQMLKAQYPNGAWPQQYSEFADPSHFPVKRASYPESWPRTFPEQRYTGYYTLNDNNMSHIIEMLFEAHRIYGRDDCHHAAVQTGEFFLLAQMPPPQPGWAQQYNRDMQPAWARRFEPAAITGGESQAVMRSLVTLYRYTGQRRFLEPLPRAITYYRSSLLEDGRLARFYELQTNRPLYFTKNYQLTYRDDDLPTHYAFKVASGLDSIERDYRAALSMKAGDLKPRHQLAAPLKWTPTIARRASSAARSLDERGAWVEEGSMRHADQPVTLIDMRTFARNLPALAALAGATR